MPSGSDPRVAARSAAGEGAWPAKLVPAKHVPENALMPRTKLRVWSGPIGHASVTSPEATTQLSFLSVGVGLLLHRVDLVVVEAEMVRDLVDQHVSNDLE
jgi:hypothetical protein